MLGQAADRYLDCESLLCCFLEPQGGALLVLRENGQTEVQTSALLLMSCVTQSLSVYTLWASVVSSKNEDRDTSPQILASAVPGICEQPVNPGSPPSLLGAMVHRCQAPFTSATGANTRPATARLTWDMSRKQIGWALRPLSSMAKDLYHPRKHPCVRVFSLSLFPSPLSKTLGGQSCLCPQGSSKGPISSCRSDGSNSINGKQDEWYPVPKVYEARWNGGALGGRKVLLEFTLRWGLIRS